MNKAVDAWVECLGKENVQKDTSYLDMAEYEKRGSIGEISPKNIDQLIEVVKIAKQHKVALYPFSTGKNWGLGSRTPAYGNSTLLNLSALDQIRYLDLDLGIAIVEPGVTQAILSKELEGTKWMVNVTGSCAHTSMLGNILDRGVGLLHPRSDDLSGLEVVLANGEIIHLGSNWDAVGKNPKVEDHKIYQRYGLGPDMVQMFLQSNLGIASAAIIKLTPRPESNMLLDVWFKASDLAKAIDAIAELYHLGLVQHAIKMFNAASLKNYSVGTVGEPVPGYRLFIPIHATKGLAPHLSAEITSRVTKTNLFDNVKIWDLDTASEEFKKSVSGFVECLQGEPTCRVHASFPSADCDLDQNCPNGWILLCLVAPFVGSKIEEAVAVAKTAAEPFGYKPDITFNFFDIRTIELVCKVRFKREDKEEVKKCHTYMKAFRESMVQNGFYACRANVDDQMHPKKLYQEENYFNILKDIKTLLDPDNIIAPGRWINSLVEYEPIKKVKSVKRVSIGPMM